MAPNQWAHDTCVDCLLAGGRIFDRLTNDTVSSDQSEILHDPLLPLSIASPNSLGFIVAVPPDLALNDNGSVRDVEPNST